jgi:cell division protease FtsH
VSVLASLGTQLQNLALTWLPVMFFLLMCVVVWLLWRTVKLMPRVKPHEITPGSESSITWSQVAGLDEAKAELQEVVDFLRDPKRFERLGARVPKGILLYGPPGTGKTLAAKAVASESGARFYAQSASAFVEMFAGLGAARIRKLFDEARKNAPSIVFIDELDAVGQARSGHGFNREQDQTLNQLLVELDGFGARDQVVVMGASNRLQDLDPALLRPGRFDRQIHVQPPDLSGRIAILRVHARGKPLSSDVDVESIARQTAGLTGADLANICNEAAICAGRRNAEWLTPADFDHAMDRVMAGLQQRRAMTDKEKRILAYHEGGHALVSHLMNTSSPVQKATIIARGDALGYTLHMPDEERYLATKEELIDWMVVTLAGRAAEQVIFGRVTTGAANDLEKVTALARSMVFEYGMGESNVSRTMRADNYALSEDAKRQRDLEQTNLTEHAYAEAVRILTKHRALLDRVAHALLEKETLTRKELLELFGDVEPESRSAEFVGVVRAIEGDAVPALDADAAG